MANGQRVARETAPPPSGKKVTAADAARMRMELKLADQRSAGDVEHLVNRRSLRLWPGGLGKITLQSDYGYHRRTPQWAQIAHTWTKETWNNAASSHFLAQLAGSEPERAHSQALTNDRERRLIELNEAIAHFKDAADVPAQEYLAGVTFALSNKTTVEELTAVMEKGLLPGLFARYPRARLLYLSIDTEACQRLTDIMVLHLYELQDRDQVHQALFRMGFFPQVQGGFSPVNLVANSFLALAGFFYPWLYFIPVARPGGVFLLLLNANEPFNLGMESPSVFETLGLGLGSIHGSVADRLSDLTRFLPAAPASSEVEALALSVAERMNDLLVALYDIDGFGTLEEQISACFTTARLCEEVATGFLTTNAYLRKITFFNVWDKITSVQKSARADVREADAKRGLVQPGAFRDHVLGAIPNSAPLWQALKNSVFDTVIADLEETLVKGAAPWASENKDGCSHDQFIADLLVSYRNSVHGYGRGHIREYLSHAGLIPDSVVYLTFFWWLSIVFRPTAYLRGRWVD